MKSDSGKSLSLWMPTVTFPKFPPLHEDLKTDVCIIGSGMAGLSCAYQLSCAGKSVVVLDDGPIAGGETCRTTAHLTNVIDCGYREMEKLHGSEKTHLIAESHTAAINEIQRIVRKEKIECDFERLNGYLFLAENESMDLLDRELKAAQRAGIHGVKMIPQAPLDFFNTGYTLQFECQAQFHPLKYLQAIVDILQKKGVKIFSKTHVDTVLGGTPTKVLTSTRHTVTAEASIVATNTPFNDWVVIHTKQAAYRTYVIAACVPKNSVKHALYWDTQNPFHYVRLQPLDEDDDLLLVGGEDHKTGQDDVAERHYERLETWATERFPMMNGIAYRWSGQVMEPVDNVAFIGKNPMDHPNVYVVTGDAGMGMTHGTIASLLLTDLICGRENPWEKLFDPARITLKSAWRFAQENTNVVAQFKDWVTPGEVESFDEILPGSGAILRRGFKKIAAYRNRNNNMQLHSAVCPHLGCIVAWNDTEKTWDCPCHGSRYDTNGKVVNGPAVHGLEPIDVKGDSEAMVGT
jgi:glycine/D-amino acid oxidase-like deaminating enzyme/nitrite reductase/ring-hydroxylating ferredoxin subunit